jgi:hypothetical protein
MKTFNQYLEEYKLVGDIVHFLDEERSNQVTRAPSVSKIIFANSGTTNYQGLDKRAKNEWRLNVPITTALYKSVVKKAIAERGESDGTWIAYHVTTKDSIPDILRLQGKRKTISTFTSMHQSYLDNGVASGGGVVFMLAGDALVRGKSDIESLPDRGGRRWLNLDAIRQMDDSVGKKLKGLFGAKRNGILDMATQRTKMGIVKLMVKEYPELEVAAKQKSSDKYAQLTWEIAPDEVEWASNGSKNAFGRWMFIHDMIHEGKSWVGKNGITYTIPQKIIDKCKAIAIKSYMDMVAENIRISIGDDLGKAFVKYIGNKYVDQDIDYADGDVGEYDEILMNNFRVLKCYYNGALPPETEALLDRNSIDHMFFLNSQDLIGSIEGMGGYIEGDTPESLQRDYRV